LNWGGPHEEAGKNGERNGQTPTYPRPEKPALRVRVRVTPKYPIEYNELTSVMDKIFAMT
jgi:hypothetical protein